MNKIYSCIIIGSGPSGIKLAKQLFANGIDFLIIEKSTPGGKVNIAPSIINYPNHGEITGPSLAMELAMPLFQEKYPFVGDEIVSLTKDETFIAKGINDTYFAKTVFVASGTTEKLLGFDNEQNLIGKGISYCAICDAHFFKGKDIIIITSGEHPLKEVIYLSKFVRKMYFINKNPQGTFPHLLKQIEQLPNIEHLDGYEITGIIGQNKVEGVLLNKGTNIITLSVDGLFPLVGEIPNTQFINIDGVLNANKAIIVDKEMKTPVSGLFAGGDVIGRDVKQIYLAEHDAMVAFRSISEFLQ